MRFQLGAMSIGDLLDRSLKLLLARFPTFISINLIILTPLLVFQLVMPLWLTPGGGSEQLVTMLFGTALATLLSMVLSLVGTGAILHIISQEFVDRPATVGAALRFALGRFGPLLAVSLLNGLIVFLGWLFCCLPGVLAMVMYAFVAQIVLVEGLGPLAAFPRSQQLTEDYRWRLLGVYALLLALMVASGMIEQILQLVLPSLEPVPSQGGITLVLRSHPNHIVHTVVAFILNILTQTYFSIVLTLFYFDLRIRKEGFDLELAAQEALGKPA